MRRRLTWSVSVLAVVVLASVGVGVQSRLPAPNAPDSNWTSTGGAGVSGARYTPLDQINTETIKRLGATWSAKFEANASTRATPVVVDGVMFISAGTRLYAIDAKTGKTLWTWKPTETAPDRLERAGIGDVLNAGFGIPNAAGVAVGEGLVFVGLMDATVAAVRQKTGEVVWTHNIGYEIPKTGQAVSAPPVYSDGVVYAALANGDWAFRGKAVALDAKTGNQLWEFYTIPGPEDSAHSTWPPATDPKYGDIWKQGGGGIWQPPVLDPQLGLVYYVTGNAVPMYGGEARKGDNLYTACILALDMKTGKLKWYYQVVHHDLWDADIAIPPILFSTTINGQPRNGIGAMRADGTLFLLDRATGKPLVPIEERPVPQDKFDNTSPTQPFPVGAEGVGPSCDYWKDKVKPPFVLECAFAPPYTDRQNVLAPGHPIYGVNRVTPMAFSPQTGYFYALGTAALGRARRISKDPWFRGAASMLPDILPPSVNVLTAIDSRTDKTVWRKELPQAGGSGPLTTAGGLLFRGDPSGAFQAFDAKTGDKVWEFQTGLAGGRAPAAAYAVDGEEYLALVMGPSVFAFKLDGTLPQAQTRPQVQAGRGGRGGAAPPADTITEIQVATLVQSAERGVGDRWAVDEDTFNPVRARVKANQWFAFTNNGTTPHTIVAFDGSFNTGTLKPGESGSVKLLRPGVVRYACKEHPWAIGEIMVE